MILHFGDGKLQHSYLLAMLATLNEQRVCSLLSKSITLQLNWHHCHWDPKLTRQN